MIMLFDMSHCILKTNELSSICPSAHQPAVFLTQLGIVVSVVPETVVGGTSIMSFETSHSMPETNELSSICP